MRYLVYSLRIRRLEYRIAEIPILLIPVLLTIPDAAPLTTLAFWEGVLIFFFLFAFGDLVNCLADRDLDAVYKPHLTEAVYGLGLGHVLFQAWASALAALALATHLSWLLDRWILLGCVIVGLFVALAYSVEPIRLKGKGLGQLLFYWLGLFAGPMVFAALVVSAAPPLGVYLFAGAYGLLQTGIILVNTAEDYPEDQQASVRTAIVALGLHRGIALALVLTLLGSVCVLGILALLFHERGLPLLALAALLPLAGACVFASAGIWRLHGSIRGAGLEESIGKVKAAASLVPLWITSVAVSALFAALALFLLSPGM